MTLIWSLFFFLLLTGVKTEGSSGAGSDGDVINTTDAFYVQPGGPHILEVWWNSSYNNPSNPEFRIIVNDSIDRTCKQSSQSPNKPLYHCAMNGYVPNSRYRVQLAACRVNENNPEKCIKLLEERTVFLPPKAPNNFSVRAADDQSIRFDWDVPVQPMTGLSARLWVWNDTITYTSQIYPVEHAMTGAVGGLYPLTEYNTTVSIENVEENLNDTCGKITEVLTAPNAPKVFTDVWDNFIRVEFKPMRNDEFFNVIYGALAMSSNGSIHNCSTFSSNEEPSCILKGLQPLKVYEITVTACVDRLCSAHTFERTTPGIHDFQVYPEAPWAIIAAWYAGYKDTSSYEFRIIVNGTLDSDCHCPRNTWKCTCTMNSYTPKASYEVQLAACQKNAQNLTNCIKFYFPKYIYPQQQEYLKLSIGGPRAIKAVWNSAETNNRSLEFCIIVNDTVESECKGTLHTTSHFCSINNCTPNSEYLVQLAVCNVGDNCTQKRMLIGRPSYIYLPPEAPSNVKVVTVESQRIEFALDYPARPLTGLSVALAVRKDDLYHRAEFDAADVPRTAVVGGLLPVTEYNANFCMINNRRPDGKSCSAIKFLTLPTASRISTPQVGADFITVKFAPIQSDQASKVTYTAVGMDTHGNQYNCSTRADNQAVYCRLWRLQPATNYSITAAACVDTHCTEKSQAITVKTLGVDYFDAHSERPGKIEAWWNSTYTKYYSQEFCIMVNESVDTTCKQPMEEGSFNCTMEGYTPNTRYTVQLAACGYDETKPLLYPKSVYVLPAPPINFSAKAVDSQSIEFTWNHSAQPLTGLTIRLWVKSRKSAQESTIYPAQGVNTGSLSGLLPLTEYSAKLSIHNAENKVAVFHSQTLVVLTYPPAPNVTTTAIDEKRIEVKFAPIADGALFAVNYTAEATDINGNGNTCSVLAGEGTVDCVIHNLKDNTVYMITAVACVGLKCSIKSPASIVQTQPEPPPPPPTITTTLPPPPSIPTPNSTTTATTTTPEPPTPPTTTTTTTITSTTTITTTLPPPPPIPTPNSTTTATTTTPEPPTPPKPQPPLPSTTTTTSTITSTTTTPKSTTTETTTAEPGPDPREIARISAIVVVSLMLFVVVCLMCCYHPKAARRVAYVN